MEVLVPLTEVRSNDVRAVRAAALGLLVQAVCRLHGRNEDPKFRYARVGVCGGEDRLAFTACVRAAVKTGVHVDVIACVPAAAGYPYRACVVPERASFFSWHTLDDMLDGVDNPNDFAYDGFLLDVSLVDGPTAARAVYRVLDALNGVTGGTLVLTWNARAPNPMTTELLRHAGAGPHWMLKYCHAAARATGFALHPMHVDMEHSTVAFVATPLATENDAAVVWQRLPHLTNDEVFRGFWLDDSSSLPA